MRRVMERAGKALGSQTAAILLARGSRWTVRHVQGLPKELVGTYFTDAELPQAALARTTRSPVAISDAANDERVTAAFRARFKTRSELVVPLMMKDVVLGVLLMDHVGPRDPPSPRRSSILPRSWAPRVSIALENARLYAELRAAEGLNAALSDILAEIAATTRHRQEPGRRSWKRRRPRWAPIALSARFEARAVGRSVTYSALPRSSSGSRGARKRPGLSPRSGPRCSRSS